MAQRRNGAVRWNNAVFPAGLSRRQMCDYMVTKKIYIEAALCLPSDSTVKRIYIKRFSAIQIIDRNGEMKEGFHYILSFEKFSYDPTRSD